MKKAIIFLLILLLICFSSGVLAEDSQKLDKATEDNSKTLDLPSEEDKNFSDKGREELLGIASMFDSDVNVDGIEVENDGFDFTGESLSRTPEGLNLLSNLRLDAEYSEEVDDDKLESQTDLNLQYAVNSRTLIRAGYSLASREWWDVNGITTPESGSVDREQTALEPLESRVTENELLLGNNNAVYNEELNRKQSLGIAYQTNDRVTVSADYIHNNEFEDYFGNSTVFGVSYTDELGQIRANFQLDTAENVKQQITGIELDFRDLATFSASYKLLDPAQIESALNTQKSSWNIGLGVNLNEESKVSLGYEVTESEDESEEKESNIKAAFEIKF
ncbi:MAG: hypothetical protein ACQESS_10145 [Bacillota bacterium]